MSLGTEAVKSWCNSPQLLINDATTGLLILRVNQELETDDRELVMRLEPLYQRDREQAVQLGEQRLVIRLLNRRIGDIDESSIERVKGLSIEQLENLGEALLDFSNIADLETWLNQQQG